MAKLAPLLLALFLSACATSSTIAPDSMREFLSSDKNVELFLSALQRYKEGRNKEPDPEEDAVLTNIQSRLDKRIVIPIGESPVSGPEDAPITVVIFSDFECPYCRIAALGREDLLQHYGDRIKFIHKNKTTRLSQIGRNASMAALAAHKQGKFWEMYTKLFDYQDALTGEALLKAAGEVGLNLDTFQQDLRQNAEDYEQILAADNFLAKEHGFLLSPTFVINGVPIEGYVPSPILIKAIDLIASQNA